MKLHLYTGQGCTLCDEAADLVCHALSSLESSGQDSGVGFEWVKVDIGDSLELKKAYGLRIPVLGCEGRPDLFWPFEAEDIVRWIQGNAV